MDSVVRAALQPFMESETRLDLAGPPVTIKPTPSTMSGSFCMNWPTNAAKYGALSNAQGKVVIRWHFEGGEAKRLRFTWREEDGLPVTPPTRRGFGQVVIEQMAKLKFLPEGAIASFTIASYHLVITSRSSAVHAE